MLPETFTLLRQWEPGMSSTQLVNHVVSTGLFSRTTARRASNIVSEMFAPRYLGNKGEVAARLKFLLNNRFPQDSLSQICFLQTARAQQIFADFITEVYWPKYSAGAPSLASIDSERFILHALDTGRMAKRWSETTIRRVSGYLLGCCVDYGLLGKGRSNIRPLQRFAIRPEVALYLAHDLHFAGLSDADLVHHHDWKLFGLEPSEAIRLLKNLSHDGHLIIQTSGELVQISWKYKTMEECLHALTQR